MSLDIYLTLQGHKSEGGSGIFIRENGAIREISRGEWERKFPGCEPIIVPAYEEDITVYDANITHNLVAMALDAGIYMYLWRPGDVNITKAYELIEPLEKGLELLKSDPERFKEFNLSNGWGNYDGLVRFVDEYLSACKKYPTADVSVWRQT